MLCNSRTRSRVLALGNAKGAAAAYQRSGIVLCRTAWKEAVVYHCFVAQLASQCSTRLPAAVVWLCVMWPRV